MLGVAAYVILDSSTYVKPSKRSCSDSDICDVSTSESSGLSSVNSASKLDVSVREDWNCHDLI